MNEKHIDFTKATAIKSFNVKRYPAFFRVIYSRDLKHKVQNQRKSAFYINEKHIDFTKATASKRLYVKQCLAFFGINKYIYRP